MESIIRFNTDVREALESRCEREGLNYTITLLESQDCEDENKVYVMDDKGFVVAFHPDPAGKLSIHPINDVLLLREEFMLEDLKVSKLMPFTGKNEFDHPLSPEDVANYIIHIFKEHYSNVYKRSASEQ